MTQLSAPSLVVSRRNRFMCVLKCVPKSLQSKHTSKGKCDLKKRFAADAIARTHTRVTGVFHFSRSLRGPVGIKNI